MDGTLVEAAASLKSFSAKSGSDAAPAPVRKGERQFHSEKRKNDTNASTTVPDAKLYRKSNNAGAKLSFIGHSLAENRHGLIVQADATTATGRAESGAALEVIERQAPGTATQRTLGADKAFDTPEFVGNLRQTNVTPHVALKFKRSTIDARTTRHATYAICQGNRKLVEELFGWAKIIASMATVKVHGLARLGHCFTLAMTAYNLIRMPRFLSEAA